MTEYQVQHQADQASFIIELEDGAQAYMRYRVSESSSNQQEVDFYTTNVPTQHRGKGLAAMLVEQGFKWADENQLSIKTSCWYAAKMLDQRADSKA